MYRCTGLAGSPRSLGFSGFSREARPLCVRNSPSSHAPGTALLLLGRSETLATRTTPFAEQARDAARVSVTDGL